MRSHIVLISYAALVAGCSDSPVLFLSRPGNDGTGSLEETRRYFTRIEAIPNDPTLEIWQKNRCFEETGNNKIEAFYYNGSDLGLGRQLSCWQCPPGNRRAGLISCAVSNHGAPQGLEGFQFDFNDGLPHSPKPRKKAIQDALEGIETFVRDKKNGKTGLRGASVVFDFDEKRPGDKVHMYIYDANGFRLLSAANPDFEKAKEAHARGVTDIRIGAEQLITGLQLDGEGGALNSRVKFIRNCLSCHGGRFDERTNLIVGSTFLDLDAVLFNFGDDADPEIAVPPNLLDVTACAKNLENIKQINLQYVRKVADAVGARMIVDRIDRNKDNGFFLDAKCRPDPTKGYVPDAWNKGRTVARFRKPDGTSENICDSKFFKVAVHKYCASCHFSQTPSAPMPESATTRIRVKNPANPLTLESPDQWFRNENLVDLDELRKTNPAATSFDLIHRDVCESSNMPHAEVTRNNLKRDSQAMSYICNAEPVSPADADKFPCNP